MINKNEKKYVSPKCETYVIEVENGFAATGGNSWYDRGGQGNFDFTVDDTDNYW